MKVQYGSDITHEGYKTQRYQLARVCDYLMDSSDRVCVLYGLRRTGKSVIILQAIRWLMDEKGVAPSDILLVTGEDTGFDVMSDLYEQLDAFEGQYIFIDEVAYFNDFIESAAQLYDHYTFLKRKKIVTAGTNLASIFVARLSTLFDRTVAIRMHHLTFYEHCRLVLKKDSPSQQDLTDYLKNGGLFSPVNSNDYLQSSIVDHLDSTLLGGPARQLYSWIDSSKYADIGWRGILNNLCLYSAGNINNSVLAKVNSLRDDVQHLKRGMPELEINSALLQAFRDYYDIPKSAGNAMKQDEAIGLIRFLTDCGFLLRLDNIVDDAPQGDRSKCYLTFPFMRYAFTEHLAELLGIKDRTERSALIGNMLEGCAVSEYRLAYPNAPLFFWREKLNDRVEECDLVESYCKELLPSAASGAAYEIKLTHDPGYSGLHALRTAHPEYEIAQYQKLEGEEVMRFIYGLGAKAYAAL